MYLINDLHVFTTQSAKKIFSLCGHEARDHCLSAHWPLFYGVDPANGFPLTREEVSQPYGYERFEQLAARFARWFARDGGDIEFLYCSFTAKLAHLFRYADAPIHCQLSFRFDGNQPLPAHEAERLRVFLLSMVEAGRLTVTSNNRYDQMYFYYFTGVTPSFIPSTGTYMTERHDPRSETVLIGPGRHYEAGTRLMRQIADDLNARGGLTVRTVGEAFPAPFTWAQLAGCRAMIVVPYAVSSGSFFEYLAMGIPLFFPTVRLLTEWHCADYLLVERKPSLEPSRRAPLASVVSNLPDPHDDVDREAVAFWLRYCDWYYWDGVTLFDSIEELGEQLASIDHVAAGAHERQQSQRDLENAVRLWRAAVA